MPVFSKVWVSGACMKRLSSQPPCPTGDMVSFARQRTYPSTARKRCSSHEERPCLCPRCAGQGFEYKMLQRSWYRHQSTSYHVCPFDDSQSRRVTRLLRRDAMIVEVSWFTLPHRVRMRKRGFCPVCLFSKLLLRFSVCETGAKSCGPGRSIIVLREAAGACPCQEVLYRLWADVEARVSWS